MPMPKHNCECPICSEYWKKAEKKKLEQVVKKEKEKAEKQYNEDK